MTWLVVTFARVLLKASKKEHQCSHAGQHEYQDKYTRVYIGSKQEQKRMRVEILSTNSLRRSVVDKFGGGNQG